MQARVWWLRLGWSHVRHACDGLWSGITWRLIWTDHESRLVIVVRNWGCRCCHCLTLRFFLPFSVLQDLPTSLFLVEIDLKRALFLFNLCLLYFNLMLKLFLPIIMGIQLDFLNFWPLLELSALTLDRTFKNVKFLLQLIILLAKLLVYRFLCQGLWIFKVDTEILFSLYYDAGLLLL